MNKDLYLVRHGQTIFNLKRIIQGWSDSPLTRLGCDQAARAGMFLRARGIEPDHAYTSTLHRTEQTIANLWPGLAYERLDGLREWFFGDFEAERVMLMPERPWRDFYRQFGGEGQMQVREQTRRNLRRAAADLRGGEERGYGKVERLFAGVRSGGTGLIGQNL